MPTKEKLLEQKHAWGLIERLCTITTDLGRERERIDGMLELAKSSPGKIRNRILYDSVYWMWPEDFMEHGHEQRVFDFDAGDENQREFLFYSTRIMSVVQSYTTELCEKISLDPARFRLPSEISATHIMFE